VFTAGVPPELAAALQWGGAGGFWLCVKRLTSGTFASVASWCDNPGTTTVPRTNPFVMTATHVRRSQDYLQMTQEVFARCLHTPRRMLEKREQGLAKPTGTAAALLTLVERRPDVIQGIGCPLTLVQFVQQLLQKRPSGPPSDHFRPDHQTPIYTA
jgi:DNA-binding transcriptional regulator YiaG